jgi:hypothetical protein
MPRLSEADALTIHHAIHTPHATAVTLSTGHELHIIVSTNGCRRCDLPLGAFNQNAKFMAQNLDKQSAAAARARAGAKITHIMPVGQNGQHINGWPANGGIIEGNKVTKRCYILDNPNAPPPDPFRTKYGHIRSECTFLLCPYEEKEQAKAAGALWDGFNHPNCRNAWYVPPGLSPVRFARWLPTPAPPPAADETDVEGVEVAGTRTWAERDAELRMNAVPLDDDDENDGNEAQGGGRPAKRAKPEPASPPPPGAAASSSSDAPASSAGSSGGATPSTLSSKQKADAIGEALGLAQGASMLEVARQACEATEVDATGKSLVAQIAAAYDALFGVAAVEVCD